MSRLTLRLPETLHQNLIYQAEKEGISLNQYIVYLLARAESQQQQSTPVLINSNNQGQAIVYALTHAELEEYQKALQKSSPQDNQGKTPLIDIGSILG
jgi:urease accessory protein UreF